MHPQRFASPMAGQRANEQWEAQTRIKLIVTLTAFMLSVSILRISRDHSDFASELVPPDDEHSAAPFSSEFPIPWE